MKHHKYKYLVRKDTMVKETNELWTRTTIGYFKSKKDAIRFVENKDNKELFENEYIHNPSIIAMEIIVETKDIDLNATVELDIKWVFE